ncbi:hypothetical protein Pla52n_42780 [Stieleria varia]|uniref:Uncharacterized protein n=1 Tax=Stieleria varia TaxID=2528005 RepID=A0A5C6ANS5_9BACT|nr:hypothetical protein Pla52n_42780 [Stieleria varia]
MVILSSELTEALQTPMMRHGRCRSWQQSLGTRARHFSFSAMPKVMYSSKGLIEGMVRERAQPCTLTIFSSAKAVNLG